ncbi:MAG: Prohibitin family protein [Ignavibacteria bacterium]|nr:Prohibitin family protein [Ignavibacteria bacterium]
MFFIVLGIIAFIIGIMASKQVSGLSKFKSIFKLAGVFLVVVGILISSFKQINPGEIGVLVLFGKVQGNVIYEGLNIINPLVDVKIMTIQTQNYTMSSVHDEGQKIGDDAIRVLCKDGLEVSIDLTVLFKVLPTDAPAIIQTIGMDYQDKVIRPMVRTRIRESAVSFDAIELYSSKRQEFETKIKDLIDKDFAIRGFQLENILVRNTNLPKSVKESIERKITADQESQRMKYVLEKEHQEAQRKRVEAQGIADAQKIVNSGLSDKLLQFEMIKVQKELVNSTNSKIIVLGGGKGNVPFIINDGK